MSADDTPLSGTDSPPMTQTQVQPVSTNPAPPPMLDIPRQAGSLHALALESLDDDQAQELVSIPLEGKSSIADHMIIASGRSNRHVAAIAQKLAERIKHAGFGNARIEGLPAADWVLVDAGDVIVHIFRPEVRTFYNLERMWGFGEGTVGEA
jgi:ribosome-associated protein